LKREKPKNCEFEKKGGREEIGFLWDVKV